MFKHDDGSTPAPKPEPKKKDKAQIKKDKEQDDAISTLQKENIQDAKHIIKSEEVLKNFDTSTPTVNGVAGTDRRLKIHVPTPGGESQGTTVALGAPLDSVSHTGFGVATFGHITMDARDPASQMILKAEGEVLVQSAKSQLYLLSTKGAMLASADTTSVLASKGITIAAGFEPNAPWTGVAGKNPLNRNADDYRIAMGKITEAWGTRDGNIALANIARSVVLDSCGTNLFDKAWAGLCCKVTVDDYNASPQVTVHAPEGFLLGTDKFGAIYADMGIDVAGAWAGLLALLDAEVVGGKSASLVGGHEASVSALWEAGVVSYAGGTEIASRRGGVEVVGTEVKIGSRVPALSILKRFLKPNQLPTEETTVEATKKVVLATTDPGSTYEGISLVSHGVIHQKAKTTIKLEAESVVELKLTNDSASLDLFKSRVTAKAGQASVEVHDKNGVTIEHGDQASVRISKNEISIGFGLSPQKRLIITSRGEFTLGGQTIVVK